MLLQAGETNILIDAGLPARTLASHLLRRGVAAESLNAVLLTHEHSDHCSGAGGMCRRSRAPVVANRATLAAFAAREDLSFPMMELATGDETVIGEMRIRSFAIPHDAAEPVGYLVESGSARIFYATDLGCVTPEVQTALNGVQLAILEANHDAVWLQHGPYTADMKARVASDTGHLSNRDCADALAHRVDTGGPICVWLAHLSRVNNSPALARRAVRERIREQTRTGFALDVALRDHPSLQWRDGEHGFQLSLL